MKKGILLIYMVFSLMIGYAQSFGIKAGPSLSNVSPKEPDLTYGEYKWGYHVGALGYMNLYDEFLSLRTELLFSRKGYILTLPRTDDADALSTDKLRRTLSYLSLPLIVQVRPFNNVGLYAGTEFSYLISAKEKPDSPGGSPNYEKFDIGLSVGINVLLLGHIEIDGRYIQGFLELFENFGVRNQTFQLSVGYILF